MALERKWNRHSGTQKDLSIKAFHNAATKCSLQELETAMAEDESGSVRGATNSHGSNCLYHLLSGNSTENKKISFLKMLMPPPESKNEAIGKDLLANEDKYGYTAMERAAFYGLNGILTNMLDYYKLYGWEDTPISTKKRTLLHSAADGGKVNVAIYLLDRWPTLLDMKDYCGDTALHRAAKFKHDEMVIFLIERGASLTIMNDEGKPSLFDILRVSKAGGALLKRLDGTISFQKIQRQNLVKRDKVILKPLAVLMDKPDKDRKKVRQSEISVFSSIIELPQEIVEKFVLHPAAQTFIELKLQRIRIFYFVDILLYFIYVLLYTCLAAKAGVVKTISTVQSVTHEGIGNADYLLSSFTSFFAAFYCLTCASFLFFNFRMPSSKPRDLVDSKKILLSPSQAVISQSDYTAISIEPPDSNPIPRLKCEPKKNRKWGKRIIICFFKCILNLVAFILQIPKWWKRGKWSRKLISLFNCILNPVALILLWIDRSELVNHLIAYVLLSLWCMLLFRFKIFSVGGKYIFMLWVVLRNFVKLLLLFSPIFIGFLVAFSIIFENQPLLVLPSSFMTFFPMFAGEFNLRDLFQQEGDKEGASHLVLTSQIIITSFVFLVSIVIMNLSIGLSVSDTARLEKSGAIQQAKSVIDRIQRADDYVIFLNVSWLSCLSNQVSLFKKDKNDTKAYEICLSLKKPDFEDLMFQKESVKENDEWELLQKRLAFCAYLLGIVFYDSSLYRKFPIYDYLQEDLENVLVKSDEKKKSE